jgi:hypothetical protein
MRTRIIHEIVYFVIKSSDLILSILYFSKTLLMVPTKIILVSNISARYRAVEMKRVVSRTGVV